MRPVNKGARPDIEVSAYQDFRGALIERLGEYCSYCEMHLDSGLAVEHVQPKSTHPDMECEWDNLLLACCNCNSTKGDKEVDDSLRPDRDDTFHALTYSEGGIVKVNENLPDDIQKKAQKLIELVGLDKTSADSLNMSDRRWLNRKEAWRKAQEIKSMITEENTEKMRDLAVSNAEAKGYFSIWMTVFADDPDMQKRLVEKFPGTNKNFLP